MLHMLTRYVVNAQEKCCESTHGMLQSFSVCLLQVVFSWDFFDVALVFSKCNKHVRILLQNHTPYVAWLGIFTRFYFFRFCFILKMLLTLLFCCDHLRYLLKWLVIFVATEFCNKFCWVTTFFINGKHMFFLLCLLVIFTVVVGDFCCRSIRGKLIVCLTTFYCYQHMFFVVIVCIFC